MTAALLLFKAHWGKLLAVALIAGAYGAGRVHQSWKEDSRALGRVTAQLDTDQQALKDWGKASRAFTGWLVSFLDPERQPDIVRIVHDTPSRDDCPHTAVSARLRNQNAAALNRARARGRRAFGSDAAVSKLAGGRASRDEP